MPPRRTRIIATLGPATDRPEVLEQMVDAGLDVARINLSHGQPEEHVARVQRLRAVAEKQSRPIAVLADLPGPKLRVRITTAISMEVGREYRISPAPSATDIGVTDPEFLLDVRPTHRILLDDGRIQLRAIGVENGHVVATVEVGGTLLPNKGINLPDTVLTAPALGERDYAALTTAASIQADWLALSFVRGPEAAAELRKAAAAVGLDGVLVIAKIERPEAVGRITSIVTMFDGVMVARGDLGVEIALELVPTVQKQVIREARAAAKPVITATDMLDSMRVNPRPTRAEASDVANAIFDGTDAVMLSGETAVGQYPVQAIRCMDAIAREAERQIDPAPAPSSALAHDADAPLTAAACELAAALGIDAIVVPTLSGRTARLISRLRPKCAIVAPVPSAKVRRRLALIWGITPVPMANEIQAGADRLGAAVQAAFDAGAVQVGQRVIVLAGHPIQSGCRMPSFRIARVGDSGSATAP